MPPSVVFVHGLRTSATMWRAQRDALERAGVPSVTVDLPGHGRRIADRFSVADARSALDDTVASLREPPYLVGFSLGGYLAIDWVARRPDSVIGLLAASCGTSPRRRILDAWRIVAKGIHALPDRGRALNDFALRLTVPKAGATDVLAGGIALEVMDDALREVSSLNPRASLATIKVPVTLVNGRFDHFRLEEKRFLAACRDGKLVVIPGASHMVSVARPREFTAALFDGYSRAAHLRLSYPAANW